MLDRDLAQELPELGLREAAALVAALGLAGSNRTARPGGSDLDQLGGDRGGGGDGAQDFAPSLSIISEVVVRFLGQVPRHRPHVHGAHRRRPRPGPAAGTALDRSAAEWAALDRAVDRGAMRWQWWDRSDPPPIASWAVTAGTRRNTRVP